MTLNLKGEVSLHLVVTEVSVAALGGGTKADTCHFVTSILNLDPAKFFFCHFLRFCYKLVRMNRTLITASRRLLLRSVVRQSSVSRHVITRSLTQTAVRPIFKGIFRSSSAQDTDNKRQVILDQDHLFHILSKSPIAEMRDRAAIINKYGTCPVCDNQEAPKQKPTYDCPECGYPTHCCEDHYHQGKEAHKEICSVLREINEDDHDLRSGRPMREFEFPSKDSL